MFTTAGSHHIAVLSYTFIIAGLKTSYCSVHQITGVCYFKIPQLDLFCFDFVAAHLNLGIVLSDMGLKEQAVQVDMYDMFCCL